MTAIRSTEDQLHTFVVELEKALSYRFPRRISCRSILLGGMGGSAISSDIVADCYMSYSRIPVRVSKCPVLPAWVGPDTLVILSSYSGNTLETNLMYDRARELGAQIVVITSGGILGHAAEEDSVDTIRLPNDMHPRHAIGYMIGYTAAIINATGCSDVRARMVEAIPGLKAYLTELETGDTVESMARAMMDKVPVIVSGSNLASVAFRWKTQLNENSKYVAFNSASPQFSIADLKSWANGSGCHELVVLVGGSDEANKGHVADIPSYLDMSGTSYVLAELGGTTLMEDLFRAIMLGDHISLRIAQIRGIDSAAVRPVRRLKDLLLDMPGNTKGAA